MPGKIFPTNDRLGTRVAEFADMAARKEPEKHPHGPDNAEHEIKKAYNCMIETGVTFFWDKQPIQGVNPDEVVELYKSAFKCYRNGDRLSSERWARSAKHLARACWHEAKIAYLEPRSADQPFLEKAREEYNLHEYSDTTADLLNSLAGHIPTDHQQLKNYLSRAREHLATLEIPQYVHELLRAERIKAAHEYGRVIECILLALEAEDQHKKKAAA